MNINEACEVFKEMLGGGLLTFTGYSQVPAPSLSKVMIDHVLALYKLKWDIADQQVKGYYLLRINDEKAPYLVVGPEHFLWCSEGLNESIHPDEMVMYLFDKYLGICVHVRNDRTIKMTKKNRLDRS